MSSEKLYSPLKVGAITAANRIFMAPLTRLRSIEPGDIPTPLMAEYYRQRASAGLIISEATQISAGQRIRRCTASIAKYKLPHGKKLPLAFMLKMVIWPYSCGTPDAFLTPACNGGQAPVAPSALSAGTRTSLRDENGQAIRVEHPCRVRLN